MVSDAQAPSKGAIMLLTNFVFISIYFPFVVLAFLDSSLLRSHFWPFTEVVRKIRREVTRKVGFAGLNRGNNRFLSVQSAVDLRGD
jgi:hypothetical protein